MNENPDNPCPALVHANDGFTCFIRAPIKHKLGDGSYEDAKKICNVCHIIKNMNEMKKRLEHKQHQIKKFVKEQTKKYSVYAREFASLVKTLPEDSSGIKTWECPIPVKIEGKWRTLIFLHDVEKNKKLKENGACEHLVTFSLDFKDQEDLYDTSRPTPTRAQLGG